MLLNAKKRSSMCQKLQNYTSEMTQKFLAATSEGMMFKDASEHFYNFSKYVLKQNHQKHTNMKDH